jgi:hypothetical protein
MRNKSIFAIIVFLIASIVALLYVSPAFMKITGLDYAIFEYAGKEINLGNLPYVDFFDHKPPAMFYLNALALFLANGSRWGIWAFELLALFSAGTFSFLFLKKYFGNFAAFFATLAFIFNVTYFHDGGNLTEEFALPLQFAILFLLSRWAEGKKPKLNVYLIGLLAGIATSLKQPLGGILVGVIAFILVQLLSDQNWKRFFVSAAYMFAGFVSVWAAWVLYFSIAGILVPFWEGAFVHNFAYSTLSTAERIAAFGETLHVLFRKSPFYMLSLVSYLVCIPMALLSSKRVFSNLTHKWLASLMFIAAVLGIYNGIFRRGFILYTIEQIGIRQIVELAAGLGFAFLGWAWLKTTLPQKIQNYLDTHFLVSYEAMSLPLIVCLVDLPVQVIMISLSGHGFLHYFMSSLPSLTILCAMILWVLQTKLKDQMRVVWLIVFLIPLFVPPLTTIIEKTRVSEDAELKRLAVYVEDHSDADEDVFIWSNRVQVYITSERMCSSSYFFVSPLFIHNDINQLHVQKLLKDFEENPPAMMIVSSNINRPFFYRDDPAECSLLLDRDVLAEMSEARFGTQVYIPEGMPKVYENICTNFSIVTPSSEELQATGMYFMEYTPDR